MDLNPESASRDAPMLKIILLKTEKRIKVKKVIPSVPCGCFVVCSLQHCSVYLERDPFCCRLSTFNSTRMFLLLHFLSFYPFIIYDT